MPESPASPSLHDLARTALLDITSGESIGAEAGRLDDADGIVTVYFESLLSGYPGWRWTVSFATAHSEPSVLETELTPADGALLAPDWVPWSERLAEYKAAQEAAGEPVETDDGDASDDEDADDDVEDDDLEDDELGSDVVHAGDVDGVDIDEED